MKHLAIASIGLAFFTIVSVGCVKKAASGKASPDAPGDPSLTLELVMRDTMAFKGSRVRWFGKMANINSTGGVLGYTILAVYVNNQDTATAEDFNCFAVEYKSSSPIPDLEDQVWITGTIEGTKVIFSNITSPMGNQTQSSREVPLLIDPKFEPAGEKEKEKKN